MLVRNGMAAAIEQVLTLPIRGAPYTIEPAKGDKGEAEVGPAFAVGNQYLEQNSGVDRLVHGKYSR